MVEELVTEVLRGFNLAKFKAISATNYREDAFHVQRKPRADSPLAKSFEFDLAKSKEQEYAEASLPKLGTGSSRVVFALSGGKVLKIATNQAGYGQNQAEADMWNKTHSAYITEVYDFAPDYKWIIAELVKPLSESGLMTYLGTTEEIFSDIRWSNPSSIERVKNLFQRKVDEYQATMDEYENRIKIKLSLQDENPYIMQQNKQFADEYKKQIEVSKKYRDEKQAVLDNERLMSFVEGVIELIVNNDLSWNDIHEDHIGRNIQGQLKLLDYGYTDSVSKQYYGKR